MPSEPQHISSDDSGFDMHELIDFSDTTDEDEPISTPHPSPSPQGSKILAGFPTSISPGARQQSKILAALDEIDTPPSTLSSSSSAAAAAVVVVGETPPSSPKHMARTSSPRGRASASPRGRGKGRAKTTNVQPLPTPPSSPLQHKQVVMTEDASVPKKRKATVDGERKEGEKKKRVYKPKAKKVPVGETIDGVAKGHEVVVELESMEQDPDAISASSGTSGSVSPPATVVVPTTPKKAEKKAKTKPKAAHWTRQEMMFLFHHIYQRNWHINYTAAASEIGRDATECQAMALKLIEHLETFLNS